MRAQYEDCLFPTILEPRNHRGPLIDPITGETCPMEVVGDCRATDPIFKGSYRCKQVFSALFLSSSCQLCKVQSLVFLCTNLCKVLWSKLCLDPVFQVMRCKTFGECCEMVHKFFVRVLHPSRVDLIM